jgi:hypothetical protein
VDQGGDRRRRLIAPRPRTSEQGNTKIVEGGGFGD